MSHSRSLTVCLMLKAPTPGKVKTRLATALGDAAACDVYRMLVEHQLDQLPAHWTIEIHGTPETDLPLLVQWLQHRRDMTFYPQAAGDLGDRMAEAVKGALGRGAGSVVLLGGDCAELDEDRLIQLERALNEAPVAIIPALDGGYVALAMQRLAPCLFGNMPWSQATLMERTRSALTEHQIRWIELDPCRDVDELADWDAARPLIEK
jgi:uncharacterized protein